MSYRLMISLAGACALIAATSVLLTSAEAKKTSDDDLVVTTLCTESLGAFPSAETEDESGKGKPPGQTGGKPPPGQRSASDDEECVVGAVPQDKTND